MFFLLVLLLYSSLPISIHGNNSLIDAARKSDLSLFLSILQSTPTINFNYKNDAGATALQWAAYNGNFEMVDALISSGADIDLSNDLGYTPLISAIMNKHTDVALYLIRENADVTLKTKDTHSTALHYASWFQEMHDVAEALIDSGADMMADDKHGHRPISIASGSGHRELTNMIGRRSGETL
jgi:uncharacterized protein